MICGCWICKICCFWYGLNLELHLGLYFTDFGCLVAYLFIYDIYGFLDIWCLWFFFWTLLSIGGWMLRILHNLWCLDFYLVELLLVNEYFLAIYIYIGSWSYWLLDMDISCQICGWFGNLIEFLLLVILPLILQRFFFVLVLIWICKLGQHVMIFILVSYYQFLFGKIAIGY